MMIRQPAFLALMLAGALALAGCNNSTEQSDAAGSGAGPTDGAGATNDPDAPTDAPAEGTGTTGTGG